MTEMSLVGRMDRRSSSPTNTRVACLSQEYWQLAQTVVVAYTTRVCVLRARVHWGIRTTPNEPIVLHSRRSRARAVDNGPQILASLCPWEESLEKGPLFPSEYNIYRYLLEQEGFGNG
jgi:hypothetical protein